MPVTSQVPIILQYSGSKKLMNISQDSAFWGRFRQIKLHTKLLEAWVPIVTLDNVWTVLIFQKFWVFLDSPTTRILSKYQSITESPDLAHIVLKVYIHDKNTVMQHVWALINCHTASIIMALIYLNWLGKSHKGAQITTLNLTEEVMQQSMGSQMMLITVQFLENIEPEYESDEPVVINHMKNLILDVSWFY
jgi:hypothetical protein